MGARLVPTGTCWCGCGAEVDLGSFFAPGHDKRAEARLIMEVFGGVPQFLVAFGRGPGGASISSDASWVEAAMKLTGRTEGPRAYMAMEYPALDDRAGPLRRVERERVWLQRADLSEGQARFQISMPDRGPAIVFIPFLDVAGVYGGDHDGVVRITGSLDFSDHTVKYVSFGQDDVRSMTARGALLLQELKPLKEAVMTAWHRITVQMPALYVEHPTQVFLQGEPEGFTSWTGLVAATAMLGDRPKLRGLCDKFFEQLKELDEGWFQTRTGLRTGPNPFLPQPTDAQVGAYFYGGIVGAFLVGSDGLRLRDNARMTYNAIVSHLDELVS